MDTHTNDIERAKHMIAVAAEDAVKTIANAAATAARVVSLEDRNNYGTIIEIKTMQGVMLKEIREIKDGTASRIQCLEAEKLDVKDSYPMLYRKGVEDTLNAHELMIGDNSKKITQILAYGSAALIGMVIIEFLLNIYFKFGKL